MTHHILGACPPCCGGSPSPPLSPSPGVFHDCYDVYQLCLQPATSLDLNISGWSNCNWSGSDSPFCFGSFWDSSCYCYNKGANLNGSYSLAQVGSGYDSGYGHWYASFYMQLGTFHDPLDRGIEVEECSCGFAFQPLKYYVFDLEATVRCWNDNKLQLWDVHGSTQAFDIFDEPASAAACCHHPSCWPGFNLTPVTDAEPCDGTMVSSFDLSYGSCSSGTATATATLAL